MTARPKVSTGAIGTATLPVPVRPKGSGAWTIAPRKVAIYPGETADDAAAFAAELAASAERHAAAWSNRPASIGYDATLAPVGRTDRLTATESRAIAAWHKAQASAVPVRGAVTVENVMRRIASAPLGYTPAPVRKPRAAKVAPVAPDPIATCNACDVRPMVAPEHPGYPAGLCADCYAEATAPEPVRDWRGPSVESVKTVLAAAMPEPAPVLAPEPMPEPVSIAPVLASVPDMRGTRERPTCGKCGQTFRANGAGLAWHVANRPDCAAAPRLAVVR
jgi:hypothetical protein